MKQPTFRYSKLPYEYRRPARDAVTFVLNKFCPRIADRIQVKISMIDSPEGNWAVCYYDVDDPAFREFRIDIESNISPNLFMRTLMHELVHVKQYAKGEMVHYERNHSVLKWRKQMKINVDKTDYWDLPWEIEAHGREEGLTQQFMRAYPHHKEFCKDKSKTKKESK
jgi:hypothetical protein